MFREKLASAIDRKNNDINSFIWKGRKQEVNGALVQEEKRLVDCTEEELRNFYAHCDSMLYWTLLKTSVSVVTQNCSCAG